MPFQLPQLHNDNEFELFPMKSNCCRCHDNLLLLYIVFAICYTGYSWLSPCLFLLSSSFQIMKYGLQVLPTILFRGWMEVPPEPPGCRMIWQSRSFESYFFGRLGMNLTNFLFLKAVLECDFGQLIKPKELLENDRLSVGMYLSATLIFLSLSTWVDIIGFSHF